MALRTNNADGGTIGTTVTTGNSGADSGTAWNVVTIGASDTLTFSNVQAHSGALSYAIVAGAANAVHLDWQPNTPTLAARCYVYFTAIPSAATQFIRFQNASNVTTSNVVFATSGANLVFAVQDGSGATKYTGTTPITLNTWLRVELAQSGLSTTAGFINAAVYVGESLTALDSFTTSLGNVTTSNVTQVWFGKASATGTWVVQYIDDCALNDGSTTFLGPTKFGTRLNNYQFVTGGDGMSVTEKIR